MFMILLTSVSEIVAPIITLSKLWIFNLINFPVINPDAWLANRINRLIGHSFHNRTAYRVIGHFDIWFINRRNSIFRFIFNFTFSRYQKMKIFKFLILKNFVSAQSVNLFTQNRTPNPEKTQLGRISILMVRW